MTPLFPVSLVRVVQWVGGADDAFKSIFPGIVAVEWIFIVDPLKSNLSPKTLQSSNYNTLMARLTMWGTAD